MISVLRFLSQDGNEPSLIFFCCQIIEILLILISIIIFMILCLRNKEFHDFLVKIFLFCHKLPFTKKIIFLAFIFTFAIPNKIYFHNKINFWLQTFLHVILFYLCFIFPYLFLIVVVRVSFASESFIFATLCSNSAWFKNFIVRTIFNNNDVFTDEIFLFFWGNMTSSLRKFGSSISVATVAGFSYNEIRRGELKIVTLEGRERANNAWTQVIQDPRRVSTSSSGEDYARILKSSTEAVRAESRILGTEDLIKNGVSSTFKSFF